MSAKPIVWAQNPLLKEALELLEVRARIARPKERLDGLESAHAAIVGTEIQWTGDVFDRYPNLVCLARAGIGCDNIDVPAATERGICVANTPEAPTESTAEFTIALMLAVARNLALASSEMSRGKWVPVTDLIGFDLAGKTLGLVGFGRIGRRVAELGRAFRMQPIAYDPFVPADRAAAAGVDPAGGLHDLLARADVVSLHLPLTGATRRFFGEREFSRMKPGSVFINAARGGLVDPAALENALTSGLLAGAGIDVWDPEPAPEGYRVPGMPNVVATPHIAAATREGRRRSHCAAVQAVLQVLEGERPDGLVNPEVWEKRRRAGES